MGVVGGRGWAGRSVLTVVLVGWEGTTGEGGSGCVGGRGEEGAVVGRDWAGSGVLATAGV